MRSVALLGIASLLWLPSVAPAAEPVFVPDFTPVAAADYAVAGIVQTRLIERLVADGHIVLGAAPAADRVGVARVAYCATRPGCPLDVLGELPGQLAVVVRLDRDAGALVGHAALYVAGRSEPDQVVETRLGPGSEDAFVDAVSTALAWLVASVEPSGDAILVDAPPPPRASHGASAPTPHEAPLEDIIAGTGVLPRHLVGVRNAFRRSGLTPRDFLRQHTPHAGRFALEARVGLGMGDISRTAVLGAETTNGEQTNGTYQDGPVGSANARLAVFLGYTPLAHLEVGVLLGLQLGHRDIVTRLTTVSDGPIEEQTVGPDRASDVTLLFQPQMRVYPLPLGRLKPYALLGGELRAFDRYQLAQPDGLTYPVPPGDTIPGLVLGAGIMVDQAPAIGVFAEISYTRHFGQRAAPSVFDQEAAWSHPRDALDPASRATVAMTAGLQLRL